VCHIFATESLQSPQEIADRLREFAKMAQKSCAPDNSMQEDGWGMILFFLGEKQHLDIKHFFELLVICFGNDKSRVEFAATASGFLVFFTSLGKIWEQEKQVTYPLRTQKLPNAKILLHAQAVNKESDKGVKIALEKLQTSLATPTTPIWSLTPENGEHQPPRSQRC